jgi:HSP20 family molecular chaperone IbpA
MSKQCEPACFEIVTANEYSHRSKTMNDKQIINTEIEAADKLLPVQRYTPAVDSYETDQELVLLADLPGVQKDALRIEVVRGILTLEAEPPVVEGVARNSYYRQFKLSEQIDADAASAELKDGVLTLRLPKSAAAQPKKIAVKTLH